MTNEKPDMNEWEAQVNALLEGELDDREAERLKVAAKSDTALARAIVEAYQLQQALASIPVERAPASLRRKLRRIPREQRALERPFYLQPRWAMAVVVIPLALVLAVSQFRSGQPTPAEVRQARQDLALAFSYLEKASRTTSRHIERNIEEGLSEPVAEQTVRTIEEQFDLIEEQET